MQIKRIHMGWAAERRRRDARQQGAEFRTANAGYPPRLQRVAGVSARSLLEGVIAPMPAGLCDCARCREVWEMSERQRVLMDLDNATARRRAELRLVRF